MDSTKGKEMQRKMIPTEFEKYKLVSRRKSYGRNK